MAKKASTKKTSLSREDLVKQAPRLALVLRALRQKNPSITSDTLWEKMLQRWFRRDLEKALKRFESSRKLDGFKALLQPLPRVDKSGFFVMSGELWGNLKAIAHELRLAPRTIKLRLDSCQSQEAQDICGRLIKLYSLKDAKKACSDLLKKVPKANSDGFFKASGECWGTVASIARQLQLCESSVKHNIGSCPSRKGKDSSGHLSTFYSLSKAKRACADLLKSRVGPDGFFKAGGEWWGVMMGLTRKLHLSTDAVRSRIGLCRSRPGKGYNGHAVTCYAIKDVKRVCAKLLKKVPIANAEGLFEAGGEWWGTISALIRKLQLNKSSVEHQISLCRARKGKDGSGRLATFYALSDVQRVCADPLVKKPISYKHYCSLQPGRS